MPRGKKADGSPVGRPFKKGGIANAKGGPKIEMSEFRGWSAGLSRTHIHNIIGRLWHLSIEDLAAFVNNRNQTSGEAIIGRILLEALKTGDHQKLDFILNRTIGKVKDEIEHTVKTLHEQIVDLIDENKS